MTSRTGKIGCVSLLIFIIIGSIGLLYIKVQNYHTITINGVERQYLMYIPESYQAGTPMPLLLGLHGALGNADQFRRSSDFNAIAEEYSFIMVYPDGLGTFKYNYHYWNSGQIPDRVTEDDVLFLETLIAEIKSKYSIDSDQVYMVGHSNGAMMTYRMACERPELFAAVASISGSIGSHEAKNTAEYLNSVPNMPVNIVHVHGTADKMVLYDGGIANGRDFYSVNETMDFWINANNCSLIPTFDNSSNSAIKLTQYSNSTTNITVSQVDLIDSTHSWDDMNKNVKNEDFYGDSLAEMIWNLLHAA